MILYIQGREKSGAAPLHWAQHGLCRAFCQCSQLGLATTKRLADLSFSSHRAGASFLHGCLTCPSAGGLAWRSPNLGASAHQPISEDLGSAEGGSFIQTSSRWHLSPIWVPPVTSGSWAEMGGAMAEDRPGAHWASECRRALTAGGCGLTEPPMV